MSEAAIPSDLTLYTTPEKFYIQANPSNANGKVIIIDRLLESVTLQPFRGQIPAVSSKKQFCGLLGVIKLLAGPYLILATGREIVGTVGGHTIWRLTKSELIPYDRSLLHLTAEQQADNNEYIRMVQSVLDTPFLYFSYTFDITHTIQRMQDIGPDFWQQTLFERADSRFVWNGNVLKPLQEVSEYCLPLLHGFISINNCVINGQPLAWILISRRSVLRAGTRLFRRGVDRNGNVANFVETEQIVEYSGDKASFVQIRGSIPLFWQQYPDLRYKPPPTMLEIDPQEQYAACQKHLESVARIYGKQVMVDLVDQKGSEGRLELAFKDAVNHLALASVKYEPFDFHAECRKMRWDRLSILINRVAIDQDEMGYFLMLRDGSLTSLQEGVFRTNCIDCLDRTNVVQSMLAHRNLEIVFKKLGILSANQSLEAQSAFEYLFKNVWADNADIISTQYSGTGALKTDFTRTGKRTKMGLMSDGMNSATRYFKNNLFDGFRQDAIDLFHGYGDIVSPYRLDRGWKYFTFPSVLLVAISMFFASLIFPAEYSTESLLYLLFWGSMVAGTLNYILKHGSEFVDRPRLTQP